MTFNARDAHCKITIGNGVAMCTYHAITMHNGDAINFLLYITMPNYDITVFPVNSLKLFIKH